MPFLCPEKAYVQNELWEWYGASACRSKKQNVVAPIMFLCRRISLLMQYLFLIYVLEIMKMMMEIRGLWFRVEHRKRRKHTVVGGGNFFYEQRGCVIVPVS